MQIKVESSVEELVRCAKIAHRNNSCPPAGRIDTMELRHSMCIIKLDTRTTSRRLGEVLDEEGDRPQQRKRTCRWPERR